MKTSRKMIAIILMGLAALTFAACGSGGSDAPPAAELPGSYTLSAIVRDGEETPPEDIALLTEKGLECSLLLETNGTGTLVLFGEETVLNWDEETISTDEKSFPYTLEDGKITITDGDSSLTFTLEENE